MRAEMPPKAVRTVKCQHSVHFTVHTRCNGNVTHNVPEGAKATAYPMT